MHAMIGIFKMDPAFFPQQKQALHDRIVPMVQGHRGFVRGTWSYDRAAARSYSCIVLDSEQSARQLAAVVKEGNQGPNPLGVQLESLVVVEVLAEAGEPRQ
jgi:hypothetical protein